MAQYSATSGRIQGDLAALLTSLAVPTRWPGTDYDVPLNESDEEQVWCEARIQWHSNRHVAVQGGGRFRLRGELMCALHQKRDTGTSRIEAIADQVVNRYLGRTLDGIHFETAEARDVGAREGPPQMNVYAPFFVDEVI